MTSSSPTRRDELAAFADALLDLAHQLDTRHPELRDVVPLTGTEIAVIREIHRSPGSSPSHIAEATGLKRSNVSTAVRALEAGGLVKRESQPGNARSVALLPTPLAAQSIARIHAHWERQLALAPAGALEEALRATAALTAIAASLSEHQGA